MRGKRLSNNPSSSIYKGGVLYRAGELPTLTKEQTEHAKLVSKLPKEFPFADWEDMTTKQQLRQMQYSGLNPQEQWSLLNSNVPLAVLNEHNQAQDESETRAYATRIAASLMNTTAQAAAARVQAAVGKPTVSTSLQTTAQQRKLDMRQEEYETKFYEKQARRPGFVNTQNDATKTPDGGKPIFDSRDAIEQKKDKLWDKIESTYNPRDAMDRKKDEMWGLVNGKPLTYPAKSVTPPLPQPGPSPNPTTTPNPNTPKSNNDGSAANYNWFSSYDEAAKAWKKIYWAQSKDFEHCALIYKKVDENGNESFTFGETKVGSKGLPPIFQPNVAESLANLYFNEEIQDASLVGFIHSHPEPPKGWTYKDLSFWDKALKILPGIDNVTVILYEDANAAPITY